MPRAPREVMRHPFAASLIAALCFAPSLAAAGPMTAGVNIGLSQSEIDGAQGIDPGRTIGLFGRYGFNQRFSAQLEVARLQTPDDSFSVRSATASVVVDLGNKSRLVPTLAAGIGMDWASTSYGGSSEARHIEGGLGLEYRAEGGLTLGLDVRMGGRSLNQQQDIAYPTDVRGTGTIAYIAPSQLQEGQYRSVQLKLGVRF